MKNKLVPIEFFHRESVEESVLITYFPPESGVFPVQDEARLLRVDDRYESPPPPARCLAPAEVTKCAGHIPGCLYECMFL